MFEKYIYKVIIRIVKALFSLKDEVIFWANV